VEGVTACPVPRAVVDLQRGAERRPPGGTEYAPRRDHVGGRVAHSGAAPVDNGADPATGNQQVRPQQVGVDPGRPAVPGRRLERQVPRRGRRVPVDGVSRRSDRLARCGVELAQRPAPAARRVGGGRHLAQPGYEPGEVGGGGDLIGDEPVSVGLPVDPAVDHPREGKTRARTAPRDRRRDSQRQPRRQHRQPAPLLLQFGGIPRHARQPHAKIVAKPVDGIHRASRRHRADRKAGVPRKLRGHQPPDEAGSDIRLAVVHLRPGAAAIITHDRAA
jgi:hypothetical protein